jgi:ankyrin repeat protein
VSEAAGSLRAAFIRAACVPRDDSHASGTLDDANAILAAHQEVAGSDIHTAAILGDDAGVGRFLALDAAAATATSDPYGWDALTHLCFSRYLRLDPKRSAGFVRAAEALLGAGASANTGFFEANHQPNPVRESALYGAAGIAHHAELTRVLLAHGADPNDDEVPYHSPETYDNRALMLLVESKRLNADSLATMLLRKADWHDYDGIKLLLDHGVEPNHVTRWRRTALHQAILRDNALEHIELMLDRGADATLLADGQTAVAMAARRGRGDVLASLARRGIAVDLRGVDRLAAACARGDRAAVRAIADGEPQRVVELREREGELLAEFAGVGNTDGVRQLLDLGVPADAPYTTGDPYYGIPKNSTALQVAAWRARHETVKLLIERGAAIDQADANGRTPLALAVRATVDSYWSDRRSPESVRALLAAGASTAGVVVPCGYADVDGLLRTARERR